MLKNATATDLKNIGFKIGHALYIVRALKSGGVVGQHYGTRTVCRLSLSIGSRLIIILRTECKIVDTALKQPT